MATSKKQGHVLKNIITGLSVNVPVLGTFALIKGAIQYVDELLLGVQAQTVAETASGIVGGLPTFMNPGHAIPFLYKFPGVGIIVLALYLYMSGVMFNTWLGKKFRSLLDNILGRFPLISTAYNFLQNLMEQIQEKKDDMQKKPAWLQYTRDGILFPCFDMGPCTQTAARDENGNPVEMRMIYMLTAPNPTSGMVVAAHPDHVIDADTDSESHMKMILSCGMTQENAIEKIMRMAQSKESTGDFVPTENVVDIDYKKETDVSPKK